MGDVARGALKFTHPEPERPGIGVLPVFTPFAGCPERCVYCAQNLSAGGGPESLDVIHERCREMLEARAVKHAAPIELAFYGGTFTALPGDRRREFMALAGEYKARGLISRIRCSTRPDAVDVRSLAEMKALGLDLVELGVQSFDAGVLEASGRGYGPESIRNAFGIVREAGLSLGVQLLPGLPGMDASKFEQDIVRTIEASPECVRLYPCMVLEGTGLARMWRAGEYEPWGLNETVGLLAPALLRFWEAGIRVIRIGLAPEPSMQAGLLAGPAHPALGQLIRSRALFLHVEQRVRELGREPVRLEVPDRYASDVKGHKGSMAGVYEGLGLARDKIRIIRGSVFRLG